MDYSTISDYFKYPAKIAELRQRLYQILIDKGVEVSANESLNSMIEKVKSIEGINPTDTLYILENGVYDVTEYGTAEVNVQAVAPENDLDFLVDNTISQFTMPSRISEIGAYKFYKCYNLSQVSIANGTTIPSYAFYECVNLESMIMPNCTYIGEYAFYNCKKMSVATMPSAYSIGTHAFYGCNLESYSNSQAYQLFENTFYNNITLSELNLPNVYAIQGGGNFYNCKNLTSINMQNLVYFYGYSNFDNTNKISSYNFPNLVKTQGILANSNSYISELNLPMLTNVGTTRSSSNVAVKYFIDNCDNLSNISLPMVSYMACGLISNNNLISEIELPILKSFTLSPGGSYQNFISNLTNLKTLKMPMWESMWNYDGSYALIRGCSNLENLDIHNITYIPQRVIQYTKISQLSVPAAYSIGYEAFAFNSFLSTVDMRNTSTINTGGFSNCYSLQEIKCVELSYVASYGLYNASALSEIHLAGAYLSSLAFANCINLSKIYINNYSQNDSIYGTAFVNTPITNSTIFGEYGKIYVHPDKLSYYQNRYSTYNFANRFVAFESSYSEETIVAYRYFNSNLAQPPSEISNAKNIYHHAFQGNNQMSGELNMSLVENIGSFAFANVSKITLGNVDNLKFIGQSAFYACYSISELNAPNLEYIMTDAFYSCKSLTSVNLSNVKYIGYRAFMYCSSLNTLSAENLEYVGSAAFQENGLININLPNCKYLMSYAFGHYNMNYSSTQRASLPKAEWVGEYAFYNNSSMTTAYLPNCVYISSYAFAYNKSLSDLTIDNCKYIGNYAFQYCSSLPYLSNMNLRYIEERAFLACYNLSYLYLPECRFIGSYGFNSCYSISTIYAPNLKYIGDYAFAQISSLTSFIISKNISIGNNVFYGCNNMQTASIPYIQKVPIGTFQSNYKLVSVTMESASVIEANAFYQCSSLVSLNISNIISIGNGGFYGCNNLDFSSLNMVSCSYVGNNAFANCYKLLRFENHYISEIYQSTFSGCSSLSEIITPYVSRIGSSAFANCFNLQTISLQYSLLTIIPNGAFSGCSQLHFPDDPEIFAQVSTVEANAFYNCTNLSKIIGVNISSIYSSTYTNAGILEIDNSTILRTSQSAFYGCFQLSQVNLPNCSYLGAATFANCSSLISVNMPLLSSTDVRVFESTGLYSVPEGFTNLVSYIQPQTFRFCKNLSEVVLNNCLSIGYDAFSGCNNLTSVSIPNVTLISGNTFRDCWNLETIYAPNLSRLSTQAFMNCYALQSVNFPNANMSVNDYSVFLNCSSLKYVLLGQTSVITQSAFMGCNNLEEIVVPECISIYSYAFSGCLKLSSFNAPKCQMISGGAFSGCLNLTSVNLPMISAISAYAFMNCENLNFVNIEYGSTLFGSAFVRCSNLTTVSTKTLCDVGVYTFQSCTNLQSLLYTGSKFATGTFSECKSLESVYILNAWQNGDVAGSNRLNNAFYMTPILESSYLGYYGKIYVPSERLSLCRNYYGTAYSNRFEEIPYSISSQYIYAYKYSGLSTNISDVNLNAIYILSRAFESATLSDSALYSELTFSNCQYVANRAFTQCSTLPSIINLPQVSILESYAFYSCQTITSVTLNSLYEIKQYTFNKCSNLTSFYAPNARIFGSYAFAECGFSELTILGDDLVFYTEAFRYCSNLTSINIPGTVKSLISTVFKNTGSLTYYNVPNCPQIYTYNESVLNLSSVVSYINFGGYSMLWSSTLYRTVPTYIDTLILPDFLAVQGNMVFANLTIRDLQMPKLSTINQQYVFSGLTIDALKLPNVSYVGQSYALANINAKYIAFKEISSFYSGSIFSNCTRLEKVVLNVSSMVRANSCYNMFTSTPIANSTYLGYYGSIYVPASLLANFAMASFWSAWTNRMTTIEEHEQELRALGLLD